MVEKFPHGNITEAYTSSIALPPASMAEAEVVAGLANVTGREVGCGIKRQQPPALPTTTTRPKEKRVG